MVKKVIDNTNKFLKGKTYKEKIQYLQDVRYQLEEEIHAFEEQNKFALKLKEKGWGIDKVKKHQIFGIEFDENVYGLATTNMLIHSDGNSNIIQGSCFDFKGGSNRRAY